MSPFWNYRYIQSRQARIYSQNGEDGVLLTLLDLCSWPAHRSFEVGAGMVDGNLECNTAILLASGWEGTIVDRDPIVHPWCRQLEVTPANIGRLAEGASVVSVDVDGMDYYLMEACLKSCRPVIYIAEYNAHRNPTVAETVPYDPDFRWDGSDYFGASAAAMVSLAHKNKYKLVAATSCLNLFFVKEEKVPADFVEPPIQYLDLRKPRHPTDRSGRLWKTV